LQLPDFAAYGFSEIQDRNTLLDRGAPSQRSQAPAKLDIAKLDSIFSSLEIPGLAPSYNGGDQFATIAFPALAHGGLPPIRCRTI
jgi:hypothetical protein